MCVCERGIEDGIVRTRDEGVGSVAYVCVRACERETEIGSDGSGIERIQSVRAMSRMRT